MPRSSGHDVITFGSAVVDMYASSPQFETRHLRTGWDVSVPLGAKIPLSTMITDTGGGATNAAVTFARLGFKTASVCRVGTDVMGDYIVQRLKQDNIDTTLIQRDPMEATGQSIILVAGIGERSILVQRGASAELDPKRVPWSRLNARWFYVTSLGGDLGFFSLILHHAERVGAKVFWNPGRAELEKGLSRLAPLIKRVDVLSLNREEAAMLTHKPPRHLEKFANTLGDLPRIAFLLSDGEKGAYLSSRGCMWHAASLPGKRVNTTGAGDALGSGLIAGFMSSCDLSDGLRMGIRNSFGVVTHMGAKAGILKQWPTEKEMDRVKIKSARF
jgi:sugar/nucleoside kinase (ribokinase family)